MVQPTQTDPQFKLRLPADLKERIQVASSENNRSMNAEIVAALEEKFPAPLSSRDVLHRAILLAHMIRRTRKLSQISEDDYFESMVPVFYALQQNGYAGTVDELSSVDLQEALDADIDVGELLEWSEQIRREYDEKFSPLNQ